MNNYSDNDAGVEHNVMSVCHVTAVRSYPQIFRGILERFDSMPAVLSLDGACIAEELALVHTVISKHLVMLDALSLPHVTQWLHQRMLTKGRKLKVLLYMLWTHGHLTLQACLHCCGSLGRIASNVRTTVITAHLSGPERGSRSALTGPLGTVAVPKAISNVGELEVLLPLRGAAVALAAFWAAQAATL